VAVVHGALGLMAVTAVIVGAAVAAVAAGASAYLQSQAQQSQAVAASRASKLQQEQLTLNAAAQEEQVRTRNRIILGTFDAQAGRAGVNPYEGSVLQAKKDTSQAGEYNAELAGFASRTGANTAGYDSRLYAFRAGQINPFLTGALAGIGSGASIATSYYGRSAGQGTQAAGMTTIDYGQMPSV